MAESKRFFQVFPELKLENNLTELLSLVQIDRIAANHKKDAIRVYMTGTRIIPKKSIYMVQDEIEKQMFGTGNIRVQIVEHYILSRQYTPQTLWEEYQESIMEELRTKSVVMYNMLRRGELIFESEDKAKMRLEGTQLKQKPNHGTLFSISRMSYPADAGWIWIWNWNIQSRRRVSTVSRWNSRKRTRLPRFWNGIKN